MSFVVIGPCSNCGQEVKAHEKRDAASIPILKRAAEKGRLTCKACGAQGAKTVDRDNPPDVLTHG